MRTKHLLIIVSLVVFSLTACEDYLKETPPGELAPDNLLATKAGVEAVLFSSYNSYKYGYGNHEQLETVECPTDILYQTGPQRISMNITR